jgi:hypothetical protein
MNPFDPLRIYQTPSRKLGILGIQWSNERRFLIRPFWDGGLEIAIA